MIENDSYGVLRTGFWFLLIAGIFLVIQSLVIGFYAGTQSTELVTPTLEQMEVIMLELQLNGNVVAWATIISGTVCTSLIFLAVKSKKTTPALNYLGFIKGDRSDYIKWGVVFATVLLLSEVVSYLLGKDSAPSEMIKIYQSASPKWILWLAIILVAPIFEEVFFRGFLLKGLTSSFFGVTGAIIITAASWALIHVQYEAYYVGMIFVWGLIWGYIKHKTGSIHISIFLHMMANFIATVQTHFILFW